MKPDDLNNSEIVWIDRILYSLNSNYSNIYFIILQLEIEINGAVGNSNLLKIKNAI